MAARNNVFSLSQVSQHKSKKDCWIVINGRVLNVTKFLEEHPGGEEVIIEAAGKDATKDFNNIGHSEAAHKMLLKYQVGILQGYTFQDSADSNNNAAASNENSKSNEMSGILINEPSWKYAAFLELVVPAVVASFFFGYRYLTGVVQM